MKNNPKPVMPSHDGIRFRQTPAFAGVTNGMRILALTLLLASTSCAQMQEYARQAEERQRAQDVQQCSDFGFEYGSTEHANCMMKLYHDRKEDERLQQRQYDRERTIQEMRQTNCKTVEQQVPQPGGGVQMTSRVVCY